MNSSSSRRGRVLRHLPAPPAPTALATELVPFTPVPDPPAGESPEVSERAGFERGYAEGLAAGRAAAEADAAEATGRLERLLVRLAGAVRQLEERRALALRAVEDDIAGAAFALAEAVLGRELALAASPGLDAVARALCLVPVGVPVVVRLHPDDAPDMPGTDPALTVVADPAVEPGGCLLEVGDCRVDAQLGPALERARAALLGTGESGMSEVPSR